MAPDSVRFKLVSRGNKLTIICLATCRKLSKLTIAAVNLEGPDGTVGPVLEHMARDTNNQPATIGRLGFDIQSAADYPGGFQEVKESIGYSKHWGALVALPNCTSSWNDALSSGDASYEPQGCMAILFSGARFYRTCSNSPDISAGSKHSIE